MKRIIRIAAITIAASTLCSCKFIKINSSALDCSAKDLFGSILYGEPVSANGSPTQTMSYTVGGFTRVIMDGAYEMKYSTGEPSLRISAPEKVISHLVVKEEDGVLHITTDGTRIRDWGDVDAWLSAPSLNGMEINGAADFEADALVCNGEFSMEINGAGDVDIDNIQAGDIKIEVNGAGDVDLKRIRTGDVKIEVNGAGDVELGGSAVNVDIELNGTGEIDIRELVCSGKVNTRKQGIGGIRR